MLAYKYKSYLKSAIYNDLRQQFSGSKFGIIWAFLFPVFQLCIYATVFALIFRIQPEGMSKLDYVLLAFWAGASAGVQCRDCNGYQFSRIQ